MNFTHWYNTKFHTSGIPVTDIYGDLSKTDITKYWHIINVSDIHCSITHQYCNQNDIYYHWFPINEKGAEMGINSIYAALVILYRAYKAGQSVLVHCRSGRNRSVTVKLALYLMCVGEHQPVDNNRLLNNIDLGVLPSRVKLKTFLTILYQALKADLYDIELDYIKKEAGL